MTRFSVKDIKRNDVPVRFTEYDTIFEDFIKAKDVEARELDIIDNTGVLSASMAFKKRAATFNAKTDRTFDVRVVSSKKKKAVYLSKEPKGSVKVRVIKKKTTKK